MSPIRPVKGNRDNYSLAANKGELELAAFYCLLPCKSLALGHLKANGNKDSEAFLAAKRQIPASSARRHCPIKREEFGSENLEKFFHVPGGAGVMRCGVSEPKLVTPHPKPLSAVPGAEAPSKSNRKWLWALPHWAQGFVGRVG